MRDHHHLLPPLHETAAQTAPKLRTRLRQRFPGVAFRVRSDGLNQLVTVSWNHGPAPADVHQVTRLHCRVHGPAGGTLWASDRGSIALVEPGGLVLLERDGAPALVDVDEPPF